MLAVESSSSSQAGLCYCMIKQLDIIQGLVKVWLAVKLRIGLRNETELGQGSWDNAADKLGAWSSSFSAEWGA